MCNRHAKNQPYHRGHSSDLAEQEQCGLPGKTEDATSLWRATAVTVLAILFSIVVMLPVSRASAAESEETLIPSDAHDSVPRDAAYVLHPDLSLSQGVAGGAVRYDGMTSLAVLPDAEVPHEVAGSTGAIRLGQGMQSFGETECLFLSDVASPAHAQRTTEDHADCSTAGSSGTVMPAGQTGLRPDWSGLARDTGYFVGLQVLAVGLLYLLPESVTSWSDEQKDAYDFQRWVDNVKNPVWDKDNWYLNYLVHPYWGATYYVRGRERGLSKFDSFLFSVFLSTLYEFGVEALFEPPSYQDLIVTPIAGSLLGLYFEKLRADIKAKGDQQKWYDKAALVLTDPVGTVSNFIDGLLGIRSSVEIRNGAPPSQRCAPSARDAAMPQDSAARGHCQGSYNGIALKLQW